MRPGVHEELMTEISEINKEFGELIKKYRQITTRLSIFMSEPLYDNRMNVPALLSAFRVVHERKEELDNLNKIINEIYQRYSYNIIPEVFESMDGMTSVAQKGRLFTVNVRTNASIPLDKRDKGFEWLRENGLGELIKETVNTKSLSAAVKEYIEEHAKDPPDDCITVHKQKYISVRKK